MRRGAKPAKAKGESKRLVARKSRKRRDSKVADLEKRLAEALKREAEALEQQTATAEILRVISSSPTDAQPVFDAILKRAATLCEAQLAHLWLYEGGEQFRLGAGYGSRPDHLQWLQQGLHRFGQPFFRESGPWRVGQVLDVRDTEPYRRGEPVWIRTADHEGMRTLLGVPLVRDGRLVGSIAVYRREVQPFTDQQTALVQTFADQAVIAIENVRLFNELEGRNRDLTEALERQTATSDILQIISSSPTEVQPVFDAIIRSAVTLCDASFGGLHLFDGEQITLDAHSGLPEEELEVLRAVFPFPIRPNSLVGRALLERSPVQIEDVRAIPGYHSAAIQSLARYRTGLGVPMLREGTPIGGLVLWRSAVRPFTDRQIELIMTFASQAVIAIENVRLFKELQASNKHLTDALGKQTATSDVLRVISRSQTDVRPVFEEILSSAIRLMDAQAGTLTRIRGDHLDLAAFKGAHTGGEATLRAAFPVSLQGHGVHADAVRTRMPVNIAEAQNDTREPARSIARAVGYQSVAVVPMLRHEAAIGTISAVRRAPGGFTEDEIALLRTFGDQAVIAIENARLLSELQARTEDLSRSVEQLTALGDVGRAVSSTLDLETVLTTIVSRAVELSGLDGGVVFEYDQGAQEFVHRVATEAGEALAEARRATRVRKGEGVVGQTALTLEPAQVADIAVPGAYESRLRENLIESGIRAVLAVPMVREGELIGCLVVSRNRPGDFTADTIELLRTFATQSALAIQNARLFREIELKSRELEAASRHKSEFLANMSHELRTPLNAIIGFSEVLSERMFGELNEKQDEYLKDIHASGQHLLSLINDILDLSKIEAGRMELELTDFDFPTTLDNTLTLIRERAGRRGITLHLSVDERLGQMRADERKIRQVVLNLLSNAIKFTPEGGRIEVAAVPRDEFVEVSVSDTGIGIASEDQEAVFEEFRQVGTAAKKVEGTGLGLALSRKFIELHGGRIWVKSELGQGSTFTFSLPLRNA